MRGAGEALVSGHTYMGHFGRHKSRLTLGRGGELGGGEVWSGSEQHKGCRAEMQQVYMNAGWLRRTRSWIGIRLTLKAIQSLFVSVPFTTEHLFPFLTHSCFREEPFSPALYSPCLLLCARPLSLGLCSPLSLLLSTLSSLLLYAPLSWFVLAPLFCFVLAPLLVCARPSLWVCARPSLLLCARPSLVCNT
jgi:hypothetical protein